MSKQAKNPVGSIETMFEVIYALLDLGGAGVTELSVYLDIPKSTLHNYLSTLRQEDFVRKEGSTYRVGIRFLELGAAARKQYPVYEIARPEVNKIAEETGELANLLIEEHGTGTYLHRSRGTEAVNVGAHIGTCVDLHSTALGKSILAYLPDARVDTIIDRRGLPAQTAQTITTQSELEQELNRIRERGYAIDDEEHHEGLRCIAAPVLSNDDRVLGAMSIAAPTNRMRGDRFNEELPQILLERVNVVELNITYS